MLILTIDTTSEHGGVAIYRDGECLASAPNQGPANIYSVSLYSMLERLLAEVRRGSDMSRFSLGEIDLFAVANGPGSFTGIRVGLAAAKAWARAFDRPAQGVSILDAMVEEAQPDSELAIPIIDARRGEFFLGLLRRRPEAAYSRFVADSDGLVLRSHALISLVEERVRASSVVTCIARAHDGVTLGLRESLPKSLLWQTIPGTLLGAITRLALRAQGEGKSQPLADLDACYIRRPDAELKWRG